MNHILKINWHWDLIQQSETITNLIMVCICSVTDCPLVIIPNGSKCIDNVTASISNCAFIHPPLTLTSQPISLSWVEGRQGVRRSNKWRKQGCINMEETQTECAVCSEATGWRSPPSRAIWINSKTQILILHINRSICWEPRIKTQDRNMT